MSKSSRSIVLFIILFGTMFLFGFVENVKGVTYPLIKTELNVSYEQQGIMVSLLSLSYVLFCLIGGILIGSLGVKKAFAAGYVIMFLGLAGTFFMPGFWFVASALVVVSAGFGLFEVGCNALAAQIFTSRAALLMSLMHFFYGVGSSLSPRVAGTLSAALGWRHVYLLYAPLALVFFIPSLLTRFPLPPGESLVPDGPGQNASSDDGRKKSGTRKITFFAALKIPVVWIFSVVLGLMVAVEICSSNWAGLYFQDVYNLDPKTTGAAFISNFYILFTISRLLSGFAIEKIGYMRSLFIATLAVIFIFILGFILGAKGVYVLPGLGLFSAIFWPTLLAAAMGYFREDAPVMTSAIIVIAGALTSGIQFLMGYTNRLAGPAWGYRSSLLYAVLIIAALVVLTRYMRRPFKAETGVS